MAQIFGEVSGHFIKNIFQVKTAVGTVWTTFVPIWATFILKSGHTGQTSEGTACAQVTEGERGRF